MGKLAPGSAVVKLNVKDRNGRVLVQALIDADDEHKMQGASLHILRAPTKADPDRVYIMHGAKQLSHVIIGDPPAKMVVDHINGITTDNRKANLRFVTFSENSQNRRKTEGTSSSYIGVTAVKGKWHASTSCKYVTYNLGTFVEEVDAAKARDRGVLALFGAAARTNNLLTDTEVKEALVAEKPSAAGLRKRSKKQPELPVGIIFREERGVYIAQWIDAAGFVKQAPRMTLAEAVIAREQGEAARKEAEQDEKKRPLDRSVPITRDVSGQAVIMTNQSSGKKREVQVDEWLWHDFNQYSWNWPPTKDYPHGDVNDRDVAMHRYGWQLQNMGKEIPDNLVIDHKNGNTDDCRGINLQLATVSMNGQNKRKRKGKFSSDYHGVRELPNGKWAATLQNKRIGVFFTEIEAAAAYNERAIVLFPTGASNAVSPAELEAARSVKRQKKKANTKNRYLGVSWHEWSQQWRATYRKKLIGYFADEDDAARAFNKRALALDQNAFQNVIPSLRSQQDMDEDGDDDDDIIDSSEKSMDGHKDNEMTTSSGSDHVVEVGTVCMSS